MGKRYKVTQRQMGRQRDNRKRERQRQREREIIN